MNPTANDSPGRARKLDDSASEPIVLPCPSCGHLLKLAYQHLGVKGNCVSCDCEIMGVEIAPGRYEAVLANVPENKVPEPFPVETELSEPEEDPPQTNLPSAEAPVPASEVSLPDTPFVQSPFPAGPSSISHSFAPVSASDSGSEVPNPVGETEVVMKSFMDEEPEKEEETLSSLEAFSNIPSPQENTSRPDSGNLSTVKLKVVTPAKRRLSTLQILVLLFVLSVLGGFGSYTLTPAEKKEELKIRVSEWMAPGAIVLEKLPFGFGKKIPPAEPDLGGEENPS